MDELNQPPSNKELKGFSLIGVVLAIVILVIGGGIYYGVMKKEKTLEQAGPPTASPILSPSLSPSQTPSPIFQTAAPGPKKYLVEIISNGFNPSTLEIQKGDTVEFINKDQGAAHWPASGIHPVHQLCPGFDSLRGLTFNQKYSFTFNQAKECPMHDHLFPSLKGKIIIR